MRRFVLQQATFHAKHLTEIKATFHGHLQVRVEVDLFQSYKLHKLLLGEILKHLCFAGGSDQGAAMPLRSMSDPDQEFDKEVR